MKSVHVIGSYHADMAWKKGAGEMEELWESFIVRLMDLLDQYPDFTYVLEQAAHFRHMAQERPDLVDRIKKYVEQGRLEVMGGMATTMDTNMPCGESFIRNMLLGMDWFRRNFNVEVKTGWLIDTFGINAQVPQLLNQAGIRHLMANRFGNEMTVDLFTAVGLDGSRVAVAGREVFGSAIPNARVLFEFTQNWKHTDRLFHLAAEAKGDGPYLLMPYIENEYLPSKRIDMDLIELKKRDDGEYFYSLPNKFFKDVDESQALPEVFADLNPEFTGTYSQRIPIRLMNRRAEGLLLDGEKWAALLGSGPKGLRETIEDAWWKMAFNQFHDVFTGSHPTEVFNYVTDNFISAESSANRVLEDTFGVSAATEAESGTITVLNGLPRDRRDIVAIAVNEMDNSGYTVTDGATELPSEIHGGCLRFAADLPAMGAAQFNIEKGKGYSGTCWEPVAQAVIENEYIRLAASAIHGVDSILLKQTNQVLVAKAGAMLTAQQDDGSFQIEQPSGGEADVMAYGAELYRAESPLGQRILLKGAMKNLKWASIEEIFGWSVEFFLPKGMQKIDMTYHIDWHASGVRLRVKLPTQIDSSAGIYEIPFGTVLRKPYMPGASKRGEWPAQRFVAVQDSKYGVALVNTGVPGVEVAGGTIWSTLLRSPMSEYAGMSPDDTSSMHGQHTFAFAIVPYQGSWQDSPVLGYAEALNNPFRVLSGHTKTVAPGKSLMRLDGGTVALSAVKLPQDETPGEIIVRVYETGGRECPATLHIPGAQAAWHSGIMEERSPSAACENGEISLTLKPYEIKTFRVAISGK